MKKFKCPHCGKKLNTRALRLAHMANCRKKA